MVPKTTVEPSESEARQILRLIDQLEDNDDVQDVYANFEVPDEVLPSRRRPPSASRRQQSTAIRTARQTSRILSRQCRCARESGASASS